MIAIQGGLRDTIVRLCSLIEKAASCVVSSYTRLLKVIRSSSVSSGCRQDQRLPNHLYLVHFSFTVQFSVSCFSFMFL